MSRATLSIADLQAKVGTEIGVSAWHEIDQERVSHFAGVTEDYQYIHLDPERAAETPFGGTIAHGFLPLSLLSVMFAEAGGNVKDASMILNYGFESVRFISPVKTGKRIQGRFVLNSCTERKPGQWLLEFSATIEIEQEEKPAVVARWLVLAVENNM